MRGLLQRGFALALRSHGDGVAQFLQVIPLLNFRRPGVPRHAQRRDDQYSADLKPVQAKLFEGGQRDDAFPKTYVQQNCRFGVAQNELGGVCLIVMGRILHPAHLRSAPYRR